MLASCALMLATMMLGGCGSGTHDPDCELQIQSAGFQPDEIEQALSAAYEWNDALGGMVHFEPRIVDTCDQGAHCVRVGNDEPDPMVLARAEMKRYVGIAWVGPNENITVYVEHVRAHGALQSYWMRHAMLHELGHHIGLDHDERITLMNADGLGAACVGLAELSRLRQLYGERARDHALQPTCTSEDYNETRTAYEDATDGEPWPGDAAVE